MTVFKYIIASIFTLGAAEEGWSVVPRPVKPQELVEERDPAIWVLFAKDLGEERIMVRFPDEPRYWNEQNGDLRIVSENGGKSFSLTVRKLESAQGKKGDSKEFLMGKWVHEHIVHTERHELVFRTISDQENSLDHKDFVNSFGFFS